MTDYMETHRTFHNDHQATIRLVDGELRFSPGHFGIPPFSEPEKQQPNPITNPAVDYLKAGLRDRESVRESYDLKCKAKENEIVCLREQIEKCNAELEHLTRCYEKAGREVEQFEIALAPYESEG